MQTTFTSTRAFPREAVAEPVHVASDKCPKRVAILRDVSRGGALFVCNTHVDIDDRVRISVYFGEQSPREAVLSGRIVHVERLPGDVTWRYGVGVCFDQMLPEEMLQAIVHAEYRFTRVDTAVPIDIDTGEREHRVAISHDLSSTGAMLLCHARFEVGQKLRLTFHCGEETFPGASLYSGKVVDCHVVRAAPIVEGETFWRYSVGVRFDDPIVEGALNACSQAA
jgi:hypothetical protein